MGVSQVYGLGGFHHVGFKSDFMGYNFRVIDHSYNLLHSQKLKRHLLFSSIFIKITIIYEVASL